MSCSAAGEYKSVTANNYVCVTDCKTDESTFIDITNTECVNSCDAAARKKIINLIKKKKKNVD